MQEDELQDNHTIMIIIVIEEYIKGEKLMLVNYNVQGTQENVPTLEINVDTVYLRSNIKQKINEEGQLYWEYDETQLTLEEYFKKVLPENELAIIELSSIFADYQAQIDDALAELSMAIGGKNV